MTTTPVAIGSGTPSGSSKRPVAKHACLACREKKVKCDGELPTQTSSKIGEIQHQRCSNCKALGIECVFVPSQRGGRRKRDNGKPFKDPNSKYVFRPSVTPSSIGTKATTESYEDSTPISPTSPKYSKANENSDNGSTATSPFHNNVRSPLVNSRERNSNQEDYLHEKVRQLQREAANIQSQLSGNNSNDTVYPSDFYSDRRRSSKSIESDNTFGRPLRDNHSSSVSQPPPSAGPLGGPRYHWSDSQSSHYHNEHYYNEHRHNENQRHHHHGDAPPYPIPPQNDFEVNYGPQPPISRHENPVAPPVPHPVMSSGPSVPYYQHHAPPAPPHHDNHTSQQHHYYPYPRSQHQEVQPPPFVNDTYGQQFVPPQAPGQAVSVQSLPNFEDDDIQGRKPKRSYSSEVDQFNLHKLSRPSNAIRISDAELDMFDLPNWSTTCTLIDLYYRYIHPSRTFLPPKHRLVYQIQIRQDASLLHAMFSCSSRFASAIAIPNPNLRDPQHWYFLAEKYWDLLSLENSLQALVLLMGALGPGGYVQQSIEGSERFNRLLRVNYVLPTLKISDWNEFAEVATKKQVIRNEDMIRTIWASWKLNVLIRINRGFPFSRISNKLLHFLPDLSFPASDSQFNLNLSIFDANDSAVLKLLHYKDFANIQEDLKKAKRDRSAYKNLSDSTLLIIAIKQMEDIMDSISLGYLNSGTCITFNNEIKFIEEIVNSGLYQISHIKKKMVIVSISRIFSLLILNVAKLIMNVSQCSQILLIKPHETGSNTDPDDVFNSLYDSKLEDIKLACLNLTSDQIYNYVSVFGAALDSVRLLEVGNGIIPEVSQSNVPVQVIGGPLNFAPASEISSLKSHENWWTDAIEEPGKTMSAQAQTYNEFPDVWLQYPIASVIVMANALTAIASSIVLTKILKFRELGSSKSGVKNIEFIVEHGNKVIAVQLDEIIFDLFKKNFNITDLQNKAALISRYIQAHGRFWPYVESISSQSEAIINYVDDVISRMD